MTDTKFNTIIYVETAEQPAAFALRAAAPLAAPTRCRPFTLSVMVYSPESGYKFEIEIEKNCTATNDELWKLGFILSKKINNQFEEIVKILYAAKDNNQNEKVSDIAFNGLNSAQSKTFRDEVFPKAKILADERRNPTSEEAKSINSSMKKVIIIDG